MTDTQKETWAIAQKLQDVAGLVERLRGMRVSTAMEAASLIQSQAARIAELEAGLEAIAVFPNPPTVSQARARALLNEDASHD